MMELSEQQQRMVEIWERHLAYEFDDHDAAATVGTMVEDAHVNHVPTMTGGAGVDDLRVFYADHFVSKLPPDWTVTPISRTIGEDQLVDELLIEFTHTVPMDFFLPRVPPTNRSVAIPLVVVAGFREGKLAHEHIYWDQASMLVQIGLLEEGELPIVGRRSAEKVRGEPIPYNELLES